MGKLIKIEFRKMRRRPLVLLATLAAILLPIPASFLAAKTGQGYDFLFKTAINIGHFVMLIPVLCIVAAMLFFEEKRNATLKSLIAIPISPVRLAWAKLIVLLIISLVYSVFAYIATLIGAGIGQIEVEHIGSKLLLILIMGIMTWVSALPCVALIIIISKDYIFSVLLSFMYAILGLILSSTTLPWAAPNLFMLLPISVISRWLLPIFQTLHTAPYPFDTDTSMVSTPFCILYLLIYTALFGWIISRKFKHWEQ